MTQSKTGPVIEGITLNVATRAQLMDEMSTCLSERRGFALATLNLDHIVKLRRDAAFRAAYRAQSHVVADGNPIVWVSKLAGAPVELLPGSELIAPLCALAAKTGAPVAFLGSAPRGAGQRRISVNARLSRPKRGVQNCAASGV